MIVSVFLDSFTGFISDNLSPPEPFESNISTEASYVDYQYQNFYQIRSNATRKCDFMNVHGLPKSGMI